MHIGFEASVYLSLIMHYFNAESIKEVEIRLTAS